MTTGGEVVVTGYVEVIGLLYTVIRNEQGAPVSIPNKARLHAPLRPAAAAHSTVLLLLLLPAPLTRCRLIPLWSFPLIVFAFYSDCRYVCRQIGLAAFCWVDGVRCLKLACGERAAGQSRRNDRSSFAAQPDGVFAEACVDTIAPVRSVVHEACEGLARGRAGGGGDAGEE